MSLIKTKISHILSVSFALSLLFGQGVVAQTGPVCGEDIITSGNIRGYADSDNTGPIYLSTESWNEENQGNEITVQFSVEYDRQTNSWSGTGWNSSVGWINFGQIGPRTAIIEAAEESPAEWGNLDPIIDLSDVYYHTDAEKSPSGQVGFAGLATNGNYTANGANQSNDNASGMGLINFENANLLTEPNPCDEYFNEYVDIYLNGVPSLYSPECPISAPNIRWTTTDIVSGTCVPTDGDWQNKNTPRPGLSGQERAASGVTDTNKYQLFRLTCQGVSGNEITGKAIISCGEDDCVDCIKTKVDPTEEAVIIEYQEV